ncbi:MAG: ATP-binding protein [Candidatus Diapherotrites archaeon]
MKEELGTVISTFEGPSPNQVDFVVDKEVVHRGQYVEIEYSEGTMIGLVQNVLKTNRYFERAESVKEFEKNGRALFEQFPIGEWEYLVAQTKPLGVYSKEGRIKRPTFPPSPGAKVRLASAQKLKDFMGMKEDGLHLGEISYHDVPVNVNLSRLLQKHLAILAMSGAGKSYLVSVLLEELLERPKEKGRMAVVVLDPHGEYASFAQKPSAGFKDYSTKTKIVRSKSIKVGVSKLNAGLLQSILSDLSATQRRELSRVLENLKQEMRSGLGPFGLQKVKEYLQQDEDLNESTQKAVLARVAELEELRLFEETDSFSLNDLIRPGQLTIIDLSQEVSAKRKQIIAAYFGRKLFDERRRKAIPPFLYIVEEAHNFCPEGKAEHALARPTIEMIAREGRKFGASVCVISQRPKRLSTTVLSQCNTHIMLRMTNPYDLKHVSESSEGLDANSEKMISSLRTGEALMVGEGVNFPLFFSVRQRHSMESNLGISLEKAAKDFEDDKEQETDESEEFL